MSEHKQLIEKILKAEGLSGFNKDLRRDELEQLSTEDLKEIKGEKI